MPNGRGSITSHHKHHQNNPYRKPPFHARKITQNPSNSIKNLFPFQTVNLQSVEFFPLFPLLRGPGGLGVAADQGIPTTSRMHVLCPQIRKNCEYQRKISAATIHFLVGKICNNSDQKTSETTSLISSIRPIQIVLFQRFKNVL